MNLGKSLLKNEEELARLLAQNKAYSLLRTSGKNDYFSSLTRTQTPKHLVFSCCDSRVPVETVTGAEPGEFFIFRNIANQVLGHDLSCMASMQYAIDILKVENVIILGHTQCGGCKAVLEGGVSGVLHHYLSDLDMLRERNLEGLEIESTIEDKTDKFVKLNVMQQVVNACKTPFIQKRWREKELGLCVSGWIYNIKTGLLEDLKVERNEWVQRELTRLELNKH